MNAQDRIFDREALRPKIGDVVTVNDTAYKVLAVGLRFLRCSLVENPRMLAMVKTRDARKWFPPEPDYEEPRHLAALLKK